MKRLVTLLLLLAPSVLAQNPTSGGPIPASTYTTPPVNANPTHGTGAPTGTCMSGILYTNDSNGNLYSCNAGTWGLAGAAGTVTHTAGNLTAFHLMLGNGLADSTVDSACQTNGTGALSGCTSISAGSGASAAGATATGGFACVEAASTGWTPTIGQDYQRCDSATHNFVCSLNGVAEGACSSPGVVLVPSTTAANTIAPTADVVGLTVLGTTAGAPASNVFAVCAPSAGACGTKSLYVSPLNVTHVGNGNFVLDNTTVITEGGSSITLDNNNFGDSVVANETSTLTHNLPDFGGTFTIRQTTPIHLTGQTAAIPTATLCAATAGNCNKAGNYTVEWAFTQTGTACGTPGTGGVTFLLTWTDQNGTAHSAIGLAMDDSASLVATTGTFHFTTSNATAWASGQFNISSNGSIIQYATGYTACGVGTGSYQIDAWVTRKL